MFLAGLPGNRWGGESPANARGWRATWPATPERFIRRSEAPQPECVSLRAVSKANFPPVRLRGLRTHPGPGEAAGSWPISVGPFQGMTGRGAGVRLGNRPADGRRPEKASWQVDAVDTGQARRNRRRSVGQLWRRLLLALRG